jgi:hypothetical protein
MYKVNLKDREGLEKILQCFSVEEFMAIVLYTKQRADIFDIMRENIEITIVIVDDRIYIAKVNGEFLD